MVLPDSYTNKPGSISEYFEALLNAEAPERFTVRFLESLEFKSTNDRAFINVLRDLGFIDGDSVPTERYFEFLDRSQSERVVAEGIREAFSDLFAVNRTANELSSDEVKNKLRTLYKGTKKEGVIARIASTFAALCEYADFSALPTQTKSVEQAEDKNKAKERDSQSDARRAPGSLPELSIKGLQYHINIVLPESRDQAVYDAIFKSLRDHLGPAK